MMRTVFCFRFSDIQSVSVTIMTMGQGDDLVLSAWQLYTALFILFWAAQLYFSSFWMTILCCLKVTLLLTFNYSL